MKWKEGEREERENERKLEGEKGGYEEKRRRDKKRKEGEKKEEMREVR